MSFNNENSENLELCNFLRKLTSSIENNELKSEQLQIVGEFIMKYKFNESAIKEIEQSLNNLETNLKCEEDYTYEHDYYSDEDEEQNKEDNDVLKFLILGWYIYKHLIDK